MRIVGVLLAIVVLLDLTPPATAANYQITDLGTLQGVGCVGPGPLPTIGMSSFATAINDRGQAAGGSCATYVDSHAIPHSVTHGFLWTDGAMADIGTLGLGTDRQPDESAVNGMNEAGQVVGRNFFSMTEGTAFLRSGGTMTSLATVLGGFSSALDINNSGQIVGLRGTLPDIASWSAFLYDPGTGQVTTLPGLGGTFRIEATAINDTGGIAGYAEATANKFHAVRWINQVPTDLGTLGGTHSFAYGINDSGAIVGQSWISGDTDSHAFLWTGGAMQDLGTLGGTSSYAYGINAAGLVVGAAGTPTAPNGHAFLYDGGVMRDLNDLIPGGSGWLLLEAKAINASGEVVGRGTLGGEQHAFLLTPGRSFFAVPPCRVVDTRDSVGPRGGPALVANGDRTFSIAGQCEIPVGAKAVSANLTVTGSTGAGDLRVYLGAASLPLVSSINYSLGQTRANDGIARLGVDGELTVRCDQASGTVHLILDVNGYFK